MSFSLEIFEFERVNGEWLLPTQSLPEISVDLAICKQTRKITKNRCLLLALENGIGMEQPHESNEDVDKTGDSPEPSGESVDEFEHTH